MNINPKCPTFLLLFFLNLQGMEARTWGQGCREDLSNYRGGFSVTCHFLCQSLGVDGIYCLFLRTDIK